MIFKLFVEKKNKFAAEAEAVKTDICKNLGIDTLKSVRVFNRYYIEGISELVFNRVKTAILSEPPVDDIFDNLPEDYDFRLAVEYLPGQFDIRADSAARCISLLTESKRPELSTCRIYYFYGELNSEEKEKIEKYLINPVEAYSASFEIPKTLKQEIPEQLPVKILNGFCNLDENELKVFIDEHSLAMDLADLELFQNYFKNTEKRDPTITELKIVDTYWSDHCRHTTFLTEIENVEISDKRVAEAYKEYLKLRDDLGIKKPITLMDIATIGKKALEKAGFLKDLDESEEINACSVKVKANIDGNEEDYLLMFKNETHNHPTEIEPFGGAATCLGGAIRDPLSGRSYVYQAMRVTGAADPRTPYKDTIKGKLPQYKITTTAAAGYSSYGNQIGLATGLVDELYHPGYAAKRMEIGAVIGACPANNVVREVPVPGDCVILLGGATGRDGCGGATGSSKSHTEDSIHNNGAEVQKGNPPEERKIQRLFRNPKVTRLIKRCNDFGAGGVSVAVGELADGLFINLDNVYKKYEGLDGTELAISESQERMAVVVNPNDVDKFLEYASEENLRGAKIAEVTEEKRLIMQWRGDKIVDISREFLNTNGARRSMDAGVCEIKKRDAEIVPEGSLNDSFTKILSDLNVCSKRGLVERFDSTIGAASVFMPFGGIYGKTPSFVMAAKLPVLSGECSTASVMSYGCDPYLLEESPFHGAQAAVIASVSKLIAAGCSREKAWLSFQEYFEKPKNDKYRFGKPFAALLGALKAQIGLKIAAIGGKDSMSGSFENLDVPPTLCSFAVSVSEHEQLISPEFKNVGSDVFMVKLDVDEFGIPDYSKLLSLYDKIHSYISKKRIISCYPLINTFIGDALFKMAIGNKIGFAFAIKRDIVKEVVYNKTNCGFIFEITGELSETEISDIGAELLGKTIVENSLYIHPKAIVLNKLESIWEEPLSDVFTTKARGPFMGNKYQYEYKERIEKKSNIKVVRPRVVIPVFPGTNCEYDSVRAFEEAGAICNTLIIKDFTPSAIKESVKALTDAINNSQIIMFPGGFSGADEPDGSGKLIATFFRNPKVAEAVTELMDNRDGLILGICNGFQALIKLGLLPNGKICEITEDSPTLTYNIIGRHQSKMIMTKVSSVKSPWMANCEVGDIHVLPVSHGEGRIFCKKKKTLDLLVDNGQIATQYVDFFGFTAHDVQFNPNGSQRAIEGLFSPDGRIFGKMAHSERIGEGLYKNAPGEHDQKLFDAGIRYFN